MSDQQLEMFPGANRKRTRRVWNPHVPADVNRREMKYCWRDCVLCDPRMLEQRHKNPKFRLYRLCARPGRQIEERCFESSVICEHASIPQPPKSDKSLGPGWEDY